jgi:hypothetical protein
MNVRQAFGKSRHNATSGHALLLQQSVQHRPLVSYTWVTSALYHIRNKPLQLDLLLSTLSCCTRIAVAARLLLPARHPAAKRYSGGVLAGRYVQSTANPTEQCCIYYTHSPSDPERPSSQRYRVLPEICHVPTVNFQTGTCEDSRPRRHATEHVLGLQETQQSLID